MSITNNRTREQKSYIFLYYIIWTVELSILYLLINFTSIDEGIIILFYLIINYLINAGISSYESIRFLNYLKKFHNDKTKDFTVNTTTFSPIAFSFPRRKWLKSDDNFNDDVVKWFKVNAKKVWLHMRLSGIVCALVMIWFLFLNR